MKRHRPLTERDWEVLEALWNEPASGVAPIDFGGTNDSHHSKTATKLSRRDPPLVERTNRGTEWGEKPRFRERESYLYRLTPLGVRLVEEAHPARAERRKPTAVQP